MYHNSPDVTSFVTFGTPLRTLKCNRKKPENCSTVRLTCSPAFVGVAEWIDGGVSALSTARLEITVWLPFESKLHGQVEQAKPEHD